MQHRVYSVVFALAAAACSSEVRNFGEGGANSTSTASSGAGGGGVICSVCAPGDQKQCACAGGALGVQVCKDNGCGWQSCESCSPGSGGAPPACVAGAASCASAQDCSAEGECSQPTCEKGCCASTFAVAGALCSAGVCDGAGQCVECVQATDCPIQTTACLASACDGYACSTHSTVLGAPCADSGGHVCDGAGHCVTCNISADCVSGDACIQHVCVAPTCTDGLQNGNETDIDCGGPCAKCAIGDGCSVGADCQSGLCSAGICQAPTCLADDFNRANSATVGNGWLEVGEFTGNDSCGVPVCSTQASIVGSRVALSASVGSDYGCGCPGPSLVAHPISFVFPINLQVDYRATSDQRIFATLGLATDTTAGMPGGFTGVTVGRSSSTINNSTIFLQRNGQQVAQISTPFQWTDAADIHIVVTINADGSMSASGTLSGQTATVTAGPGLLPGNLSYAVVWDSGNLSSNVFSQTLMRYFDNFSTCN
jgi:hypothetical protein